MASGSPARPPGWAEESHALWVTIPVLVLTPITIVLFGIRTWARRAMTGFVTEDWVLLVGFVCLPLPEPPLCDE